MRPRDLRAGLALAIVPAAIAAGLLGAAPASASDQLSTVTAFPAAGTLAVDFGDDWSIPITVKNRASYDGDGGIPGTLQPMATNAGTVDVMLEGSPGVWASDLPLQPGGVAFLAQPSAKAALGSGTHRLTAVFDPAAGSGYDTSKTATPFTITVTGYDLGVTTKVVDDPSAVSEPTLRMSLSGNWIAAHDGHAPAGTWAVTVTDLKSSETVLRRGFVQGSTNAELTVPFGYRTDPGHRYRIETVFAPAAWLAPGVTVAQADPIGYATIAPSPLSFLVNPVAVPLWGAVGIGVAVLLLVAAAVVLLALGSRTRRRIEQLRAGKTGQEPVPPAVDPAVTGSAPTGY